MIVWLHKWFIIYAVFLSIGINCELIKIEVASNLLEGYKGSFINKRGCDIKGRLHKI